MQRNLQKENKRTITWKEYLKLYEQITGNLESSGERPSLLLHSCCAPCSTSVLARLCELFTVTVFYSNSNVYPREEFEKRLFEQKRFCKIKNIPVIEDEYLHGDFTALAASLENESEGGERCKRCIAYRMEKTAEFAKAHGFEYFTTTLSVSPHKNAEILNRVGAAMGEKYDVKYLMADFKKKNGYLRSLQLSKEFDLYRQDYCGCLYSKPEKE